MSELMTAEKAKEASNQMSAKVIKLLSKIDEYIIGATNRGEFKVFIKFEWIDADTYFYRQTDIVQSLEDRGFKLERMGQVAVQSGFKISWEES